MEEVDDTPTNELPTVGHAPITDHTAEESYTLLQKGLFLAVILGCVAAYLRMSSKKGQGRFNMEKSIV
jgi:hypothetical protein